MGQKWETVPRRAFEDTKKWLLGTLIAWILTSIMGVIVGAVVSAFIIPPPNTALIYRVLYGVVGAIVTPILLIVLVYLIHFMITPTRQRNVLRRELDNIKEKKPTSVEESITQGFAELAQVFKDVRQNPHFASQNQGQPYVIRNIDTAIGITETKTGKPAFLVPIDAGNLGIVSVGSTQTFSGLSIWDSPIFINIPRLGYVVIMVTIISNNTVEVKFLVDIVTKHRIKPSKFNLIIHSQEVASLLIPEYATGFLTQVNKTSLNNHVTEDSDIVLEIFVL